MRDNLVFCGLQECDDKDTEEILDEFLRNQLKLDTKIDFDRVHRMGGPRAKRPRPIVAKFTNYKHRDSVRKAAFAELKGTHFYDKRRTNVNCCIQSAVPPTELEIKFAWQWINCT